MSHLHRIAPILAVALLALAVPACEGGDLSAREAFAQGLGGQQAGGGDHLDAPPHERFLLCFDDLEQCVTVDGVAFADCREEFDACAPRPPQGPPDGADRPDGAERPDDGQRPDGPPPEDGARPPRGDDAMGPPPPRGERPDGGQPPRDGQRPEGEEGMRPPMGAMGPPPPLGQCLDALEPCLETTDASACFDDAHVCIEDTLAEHLQRLCTDVLPHCLEDGADAPPPCERLIADCGEEL